MYLIINFNGKRKFRLIVLAGITLLIFAVAVFTVSSEIKTVMAEGGWTGNSGTIFESVGIR